MAYNAIIKIIEENKMSALGGMIIIALTLYAFNGKSVENRLLNEIDRLHNVRKSLNADKQLFEDFKDIVMDNIQLASSKLRESAAGGKNSTVTLVVLKATTDHPRSLDSADRLMNTIMSDVPDVRVIEVVDQDLASVIDTSVEVKSPGLLLYDRQGKFLSMVHFNKFKEKESLMLKKEYMLPSVSRQHN